MRIELTILFILFPIYLIGQVDSTFIEYQTLKNQTIKQPDSNIRIGELQEFLVLTVDSMDYLITKEIYDSLVKSNKLNWIKKIDLERNSQRAIKFDKPVQTVCVIYIKERKAKKII